MPNVKIRRKPVPARAPENDVLAQALNALQRSEAPFYEGIELLKLAKNQCGELLANRNRYAHAMRALNIIAGAGCQFQKKTHKTCNVRGGAIATWCYPCYAKHVLEGGAP